PEARRPEHATRQLWPSIEPPKRVRYGFFAGSTFFGVAGAGSAFLAPPPVCASMRAMAALTAGSSMHFMIAGPASPILAFILLWTSGGSFLPGDFISLA